MLDAQLTLVESADEAAALMRWLGERRPLLGLDTETTGLHPYAGDTLRMVQFGDRHHGWAVSSYNWRGLCEQALNAVIDGDMKVALANNKFDRHALQQAGLPVPEFRNVHDTVIMARLVAPLERAGLKETGERLFPGSSVGEYVLNDAKRQGGWTWATIPEDHPAYWQYSAWDPVLTVMEAEDLWPQVQQYRGAYDREMAVQGILYGAERRGMRIDPAYTSALRREWGDEMDVLMGELNAMGLENPNSARQIALAMQQTEKWQPDDFTETGQVKMDNAVLVGIDSDISRRVLRYRRLKKWCSSYLDKFLRLRDAEDHIHPSINTLQARTGRMSITGDAALQTLPRGYEIRDCVIPDEGKALWAIDYDTMEMRAFAHYAQCGAMIEAIKDGLDLHTFCAQEVYGDPTITKNDPRRQLAKNTGFCTVYGGGAVKIAETAGVSEDVARGFLTMYLDKFPEVSSFMRTCGDIGRVRLEREGEAYITTWGGRRAPADDDRIYALLNYLIQGSCADVFKEAIIQVDAMGYGENIICPVHDELLLQFDEGDTKSPREVHATMENRRAFTVPLTCETTGPLDRWGTKYRKAS